MNDLFGVTRDVVGPRHALRTPAGFVPSQLPGWTGAVCVVQISPAMGAKFCQLLITMGKNGEGRGQTGDTEYFIYVLGGRGRLETSGTKAALSIGSYVYLPAEVDFHIRSAAKETRLLIFQKKFEALAGVEKPGVLVGNEQKIKGQPFLGNDDARLQVLLPDHPAFDLAVNIFTYQPGATLPFVETHIMEHGLLMLAGQGIYRLESAHYPVQAGDVIWMAPYCPQWFVAMGKTPASYIYYKDVNRAP